MTIIKPNRNKILTTICGSLITLFALGLVAYHATPHCSFTSPHQKTNVCARELVEICPGAFRSFSRSIRGGKPFESNMMCPWRKPTSVIGLVSLCLTQILMILFALQFRGKALKTPITVLATLVLPLLLVGAALMVKDITDGFDYYYENPGEYKFMPGTYIVNALLMIVSVFVVGWAVKCGFVMETVVNKSVDKEKSFEFVRERVDNATGSSLPIALSPEIRPRRDDEMDDDDDNSQVTQVSHISPCKLEIAADCA